MARSGMSNMLFKPVQELYLCNPIQPGNFAIFAEVQIVDELRFVCGSKGFNQEERNV
jgi:hypothetical protein